MTPQDKIILILGATGVIGTATFEKFAESGAALVVTGNSSKKVKKFASLATVAVVDVTSDIEVKNFFKKIEKKYKKIDVMVTAFGIYGTIGMLSEVKPETWRAALEVNLLGTVRCIHYAIPLLRKSKRGKIITFAGGGEGGKSGFSAYVSSKAALLRLVETVADELRDDRIDINCVSPGAVKSQFTQEVINAGPLKAGKAAYEEALRQMNGEAATVSPALVAELVAFLASAESDGISGKNISVARDPWKKFSTYKKEIMNSDVYSMRRIKPKDRGYDW